MNEPMLKKHNKKKNKNVQKLKLPLWQIKCCNIQQNISKFCIQSQETKNKKQKMNFLTQQILKMDQYLKNINNNNDIQKLTLFLWQNTNASQKYQQTL